MKSKGGEECSKRIQTRMKIPSTGSLVGAIHRENTQNPARPGRRQRVVVIAVKREQITKDGVQCVSLEKTPALAKAQKEQGWKQTLHQQKQMCNINKIHKAKSLWVTLWNFRDKMRSNPSFSVVLLLTTAALLVQIHCLWWYRHSGNLRGHGIWLSS